MSCYHYYLVPFESVPSPTPSNMRFACWTAGDPIVWTSTKPHDPDNVSTFAVGVVWQDTTRNDLTPLGTTKGTPPPVAAFSANNIDDFKSQFIAWTVGGKSFGELPASARLG